MDNRSFHDPIDIGHFDLAISQVAQVMSFDFRANPVVIEHKFGSIKKPHEFGAAPTVKSGAKVVIRDEKNPNSPVEVVSYTVGSGLTLSEADQVVTITMGGVTFTDFKKKPLKAYCSFVAPGDIEYTFTLTIVDSPL